MNRTVARIIDILQLLADAHGPLGMADVWKALDLPKSSASDLINSLIALEILEFNAEEANALEPGIRFFELAARFVGKNRLLPIARANMNSLVRDIGFPVFLSLFDGRKLMFLEKADTRKQLQAYYAPGELLSLHASAPGKAVLAACDEAGVGTLLGSEPPAAFTPNTLTTREALERELRETRERKYSVENRERSEYLVAVGAPIRQFEGKVVAALSAAIANEEQPETRVTGIGPLVYAAAFRISRYLGFSGADLFAAS